MTFARTTIASLLVAVAASLATTANAASYHSIDAKAVKLQSKASQLYWEFNLHFRHAAHFDHLRSDASQMYFLARDIHLLAHSNYGLSRMSRKLDQLDALFHHVEDLLNHIVEDAEHGHGHIHGHLGHVKELVESMECTLHSLRAEVKDLEHHLYYSQFHGPAWGHTGHVPHGGHGYHGGHGGHNNHGKHHKNSISFGNGSFKIRFGF